MYATGIEYESNYIFIYSYYKWATDSMFICLPFYLYECIHLS